MPKYFAAYKCQLCGHTIMYGDPTELQPEALPEFLAKVMQRMQMQSNPFIIKPPLYLPHKCKNGCVGVAQFAGFGRSEAYERR